MKIPLALFIFISLFGPSARSQNEADLIRQARLASNQAIARQDIEAVSKFCLDDFVIVTGSGAIEVGKEAFVNAWKKMTKESPQTYFERIPDEIIISQYNPDIAWESGTWKGFNTYSAGGHYSAQWKKKNGEWKLQAELFVALEK